VTIQDPEHSISPVESLYYHHHKWLVGWLRRRLGNALEASDLAHDTFVRILNKDTLPVIREPRALLTTIAQGIVANFHRHQRIEQAYLDALAQMPESLAPSPEAQVIMLETLVEIDTLLDGMPPLVRKVFLLSQLDGLRQSEIAKRCGISVPTVKRYVARALEQCCFAG
jgi:RNA polymerase sigma factor (sigma-70 family)